jgi:hypothetical protein
MTADVRRRPGETVALRELWDGRIWSARAAIVVRDDEEARILFTPYDTTVMVAFDEDGHELRIPTDRWVLRPSRRHARHVLSFAWPTEPYAILAMWDPHWRFRIWYVNVEEPLRPTPVGFDTNECLLDVVIEPDLSSWRWKDEDELGEAVSLGLFSARQAAAFRRAGERGRRRVIDRAPPFDRDWSGWRPDAAWTVPELPPGWDVVG